MNHSAVVDETTGKESCQEEGWKSSQSTLATSSDEHEELSEHDLHLLSKQVSKSSIIKVIILGVVLIIVSELMQLCIVILKCFKNTKLWFLTMIIIEYFFYRH